MKIYVRNTLSGLVPLYGSDYDEKRKLKIGQDYEVQIRLVRNPYFHRKFFALLNIGHQNSPNYSHLPFDTFRRVAVMKAGYFISYDTPKGVIFEAESISFDNMDDDRFGEVYSNVVNWIIKDCGITAETIEDEIRNFL